MTIRESLDAYAKARGELLEAFNLGGQWFPFLDYTDHYWFMGCGLPHFHANENVKLESEDDDNICSYDDLYGTHVFTEADGFYAGVFHDNGDMFIAVFSEEKRQKELEED
jgi:hypothetical protein